MQTVIGVGSEIGPYRIESLLGRGGMAEVYKAWHTGLGRYEAMKVLQPERTYDKSFTQRFLSEARTAAGLRHPNIATVYTVGSATDTQPYFTMELIDGINLAEALTAHGQPSLTDSLAILQQIAGALDYAHSRGVIHRDIKPANVLIENETGGHWIVKVVDFGIARAQESTAGAGMTQTGMIIGTPEYMSPEQAGNGRPVDSRSDIYSLGAIAYEMLCGHPPFAVTSNHSALSVVMQHVRDTPPSPSTINSTIPRHVSAAIMQALAKEADQRFPSCGAFIAALEGGPSALAKPSISSTFRAPSRGWNSPPGVKKSRAMPIIIGICAVLGVALIGISVRNRPAPPPLTDSTTGTTHENNNNPPPPRLDDTLVPDVGGMTEDQARSFADAKNEQVSVEKVADDNAPVGHVVSQSPKPGAHLAAGSSLVIRVSTGPSLRSTSVRQDTPLYRTPPPSDSDVVLTKWLTPMDVGGRSADELRIMRNSIYAHHGYLFHDPALRAHFSQFRWYHPYTADQQVVWGAFSETERHNADLLRQVEASVRK